MSEELTDYAALNLRPGDTLILWHRERMIPSVLADTEAEWERACPDIHLAILGYGPLGATHSVVRRILNPDAETQP